MNWIFLPVLKSIFENRDKAAIFHEDLREFSSVLVLDVLSFSH